MPNLERTNSVSHYKRSTCRACRGARLEAFLSLGQQPLANSFLSTPSEFAGEKRYPLDVYRCESCSLIQLLDVITQDELFRDYIYVTGTSETIARHNEQYAKTVTSEMQLGQGSLVIEVASNDGSLLQCFAKRGVKTLGIEPARNIARTARERGIPTVEEFFNYDLAREIRSEKGPARVVIANNVLAHVDEPIDFLTGCAELIEESGRVITEVPYLGDLLDALEYDTIYHEHLCYFSVMSLMELYERAGLMIVRIQRVPVHGGSLRILARLRTKEMSGHAPEVVELADEERRRNYDKPDPYRDFAVAVAQHREKLVALLEELVGQGKALSGYGAPAKGNTLLNYCGIDRELLKYVVDRNPLKIGRYTPGTHVPVKPVSELENDPPDYLLVLAWNFADEIMQQQIEYARRGGRFIIPVPEPRVI